MLEKLGLGCDVISGLNPAIDSLGVEYRRAPLLGEHTREILTALLGINEAGYAQLDADGVLS